MQVGWVQEQSWKQGGSGWGGQGGSAMEVEEDTRTEVGSPDMGVAEYSYDASGARTVCSVALVSTFIFAMCFFC